MTALIISKMITSAFSSSLQQAEARKEGSVADFNGLMQFSPPEEKGRKYQASPPRKLFAFRLQSLPVLIFMA